MTLPAGESLRLRLDVSPPESEQGHWHLTLGLAATADVTLAVTAEDVWKATPEAVQMAGQSDPTGCAADRTRAGCSIVAGARPSSRAGNAKQFDALHP